MKVFLVPDRGAPKCLLLNGSVVTQTGPQDWDLAINGSIIERVITLRAEKKIGRILVRDDFLEVSDESLGNSLREIIDAWSPARETEDFEPTGIQVVDCEGKYIFPGLIDLHAHFRDLEQSEKETFQTGSRAAIKGGIVLSAVMPNTKPPATNVTQVMRWMDRAMGNIYSDVAFWAGVPSSLDPTELREIIDLGVVGFKVYPHTPLSGIQWDQPQNWNALISVSNATYSWIAIHPDTPVSKSQHESRYNAALSAGDTPLVAHDKAFPVEDEVACIRLIGDLPCAPPVDQGRNLARLYFCHVSAQASVEKLRDIRKNFPNLVVEVTPHHLLLACDVIKMDPPQFAKVLPPLRASNEKLAYPEILHENIVSVIGTDHAPHTLSEKGASFFEAPSGFPGNELLLPLLCTEAFHGHIRLSDIVQKCCLAPARLLGLENLGTIREGNVASFVVVEKIAPQPVNPESFETKARYSPYLGRPLEARVSMVFLRGKVVVRDGRVMNEPEGEILKISRDNKKLVQK